MHLNSPSSEWTSDLRQLDRWRVRYDLGLPIACRAEVWCDYREEYHESWYDDPARCPVAPIYRIGIYLINDLVRLFGEAEEVQVMHSRLFTRRPTPDNVQLGIKIKSGAIGNIFASFCIDDGQAYKYSLDANYERGTMYRNVEPKPFDENTGTAGSAGNEMMLVTQTMERPFLVKRKKLDGSVGQYHWKPSTGRSGGSRWSVPLSRSRSRRESG